LRAFSVQALSASVLVLVKQVNARVRSALRKKNVTVLRVWARLSVRQKPYPYAVF
jgi:hypothetical protein